MATSSARAPPDYVFDPRLVAPMDVIEYPNSHVFVVELPGVKSSDINVWIERNKILAISGERKRELVLEEMEGLKFPRTERTIGKFVRRLLLADDANKDRVSASFGDGILTVTVEKLPLEVLIS